MGCAFRVQTHLLIVIRADAALAVCHLINLWNVAELTEKVVV